ncbi:TIGR01777 family protein [Vibrio sp. vnigr-6D03]|uniref:TIGR01777 family oxidoreductase n=1 Tax=Vibrio sp. vnigr-6D03 TaxID=2058088 RepID=UPI000C32E22C|nr:TIGR01777 family oxidoreductase [Vibrio sp. vnigr-6D03]PKF78265.1 TIGR01777 family protein [Vibrio sp. vnigr-6D03]
MKVLLTGGTGFIGKELVKHLAGHQLVVLTRNIEKAREILTHADFGNIEYIADFDSFSDLNDFDAVINLAGEPIADKRWSDTQKQKICDSRWDITKQVVSLVHASTQPPSVFISGSAVGYYGDQQSHPFDENLHVHQEQFAHQVCSKWETIAKRAESDRTRVCLLRTGIVLGTNGGALEKMILPYRMGLGGPIGSGKQYMPWIHLQDMVRAIMYLLETDYARGVFNLCAPHPVQNQLFSKTLAKVLNRPHILFTPKWVIQLALGEASSLLFDSIRAKPKHLTELGFIFTYSRLEPALKNILQHQD